MLLKKYVLILFAIGIQLNSAESELQAPKNRTAIFIPDSVVSNIHDPMFTSLLRAIGEGENPIIVGTPLFKRFAQSVLDYKKCADPDHGKSALCPEIKVLNRILDSGVEKDYQELTKNIWEQSKDLTPREKFALFCFVFTNFDQDDWIIKSVLEEAVLLVPKKYIEKIGASGLTGRELDIQVGFKMSHLPEISVQTQEGKSIFAIGIENTSKFKIQQILDQLFVTKKDLADAYASQNYNWYFYLIGHGDDLSTLPLRDESKRTEFFETLNSLNAQIASLHFNAPNNFKPESLLKEINEYQAGTISAPDLTKIIYETGIYYDQNSSFSENIAQLKYLLTNLAHIQSQLPDYYGDNIAGLRVNNFKTLLDFFNEQINTKFLFYITCYGGGASAVIPYLGKGYNYTIVSNSVGNGPTLSSEFLEKGKIQIKTTNTNRNNFVLISETIKINDLFNGLINKRQSLAKTLSQASVEITPAYHYLQYILVRYKNTQSFVPFIQTKHTSKVITLNKKIIESYLTTNRKIVLTTPTMILAYSTFIPIPIIVAAHDLTRCFIAPKIEGEPLAIQEIEMPYVYGDWFISVLRHMFLAQNNNLILIKNLRTADKTYKNIIIDNNSLYHEAAMLKIIEPDDNLRTIFTDNDTGETFFYSTLRNSTSIKQIPISSSQVAEINTMFDRVYEKQVRVSNLSTEIARTVAANIVRKRATGPIHTEQPS